MSLITEKLKERESWVLILGNVVGLLLATGVVGKETADLWIAKGGESIGLLFMLISNSGFLLSRGIAKHGAEGAETARIKALNRGLKV